MKPSAEKNSSRSAFVSGSFFFTKDEEQGLKKVTVPIIGINGSFDNPYSKTHRLWREARLFQNVTLRAHAPDADRGRLADAAAVHRQDGAVHRRA